MKKAFELAASSDKYKLSKAENVFRKITAFALPVAGAGLIVASFMVPGLGVIGLPVLLALGAAGLLGPIWGHIMAGRIFGGSEQYDLELEKQKSAEAKRVREEQHGVSDPLRVQQLRQERKQAFVANEAPKLQQKIVEALTTDPERRDLLGFGAQDYETAAAKVVPSELINALESKDIQEQVEDFKSRREQQMRWDIIEKNLKNPDLPLTPEQQAFLLGK